VAAWAQSLKLSVKSAKLGLMCAAPALQCCGTESLTLQRSSHSPPASLLISPVAYSFRRLRSIALRSGEADQRTANHAVRLRSIRRVFSPAGALLRHSLYSFVGAGPDFATASPRQRRSSTNNYAISSRLSYVCGSVQALLRRAYFDYTRKPWS
jgi:hypothetical protein